MQYVLLQRNLDQRFTLWNRTKKKSCKWLGQKEETVSRRSGKSGGAIEKTYRETCGRCSTVQSSAPLGVHTFYNNMFIILIIL
mmetsp:Transcript_19516/g.29543  ORF Transcript_19516/g.29543 Transcript_19516/m.29543 type:complete len:83 (+) Transcript_19516:89-337(+)